MINECKKTISNIPPKIINEHSQNDSNKNLPPIIKYNKTNILKNKIIIPKITLNEKKLTTFNLIESKKRINSLGKVTKYNYNNYTNKNYSLLFAPTNKELNNYYHKKNRNDINNIIIKKCEKSKSSEMIHNIHKNNEINIYNSSRRVKDELKKIKKISSLSKDKSINNVNEKDKKYKKKEIKKLKMFDKEQLKKNTSDIMTDIKNYIENKRIERFCLNKIINNSNYNIGDNDSHKKMWKKKYSPLIEKQIKKLLEEKKVNSNTLELITSESNYVKSFLEPKLIKKGEEFKNRALRKKIIRENKMNNPEKILYCYKPKNNSNSVVENQLNVIENKLLNDNDYSRINDIDIKNSFQTQLFLSIVNPYEQLFNTRLYGKLINDNDFLKELHNNENINLK
jgi:hypothetical protein